MIFHPRPGQRVRIHYARRSASVMPHHGKTGVVRTVAKGPGPRNVAVEIDGAVGVVRIAARGPGPGNVGVEIDGRLVVVPRGNLVAIREAAP